MVRDVPPKLIKGSATPVLGIDDVATAIFNAAWIPINEPNTGVALPFISYGGTSLTMLMGEIGIVLNISKSVKIN